MYDLTDVRLEIVKLQVNTFLKLYNFFCLLKREIFLPTSLHHPDFVTLPQPAGLAALPPIPVYSALIGCRAHVVIVT